MINAFAPTSTLKKNYVYEVIVTALSHEGRGIATLNGQRVFIEGALPGENVKIKMLGRKRKIWNAQVEEILTSSSDRQIPPCEFAATCGGCSLQHMTIAAQHVLKEETLRNQLQHFGQCQLEKFEPVLAAANDLGYRKKARLGVRFVAKKNKVLIGFREKNSSFLADMTSCAVVDPRVGHQLLAMQDLLSGLDAKQTIPQIEVAASDAEVALIVRHLEPLSAVDQQALTDFCANHDFHLYLQPGGVNSVHRVWPLNDSPERLQYNIDQVTLGFHPLDFTQVNSDVNQQMVARALDWLDLQPTDQVLDLFCGLGNFTLPIAKRVAKVIGVEGSSAMVDRGYENAQRNQLTNCDFYAADLFQEQSLDVVPWAELNGEPVKVLLDPPRSGAESVVRQLAAKPVQRIVYVSCNPATLARDTAILQEAGFKCLRAGMMDMFPHTHHMEAIALFERKTIKANGK